VLPAKSIRIAIAAFFLVLTATAVAQEIKLPPVDEAAADATWLRFRARLLEALARRDQKFVLGVVDGGIRNISEKSGVAEFKKLWEPQSADSPLWVELPKILFLGGVFVTRGKNVKELCAPYIYFVWPDAAPGEASGAIIAKGVFLKSRPTASADTLRTLSYDLVNVIDWEVADENKETPQAWVKVRLGGAEGYVPEQQVRSPLEYRACFAKSGVNWRMTALEVGE
jgi:hypothetical protein